MPSTKVLIRVFFLATLVIVAGNDEAHAQRGAGNYRNRINQIRNNAQKDIAAVQKQLTEAQTELGRASTELRQAQTSIKEAQTDVERAKKSLTERLGPKVGLPEAVAVAEHAHADYASAVAKAEAQLGDTPKFLEAKERMEEAEKRKEAVRQEGGSRDRLTEASKAALQACDAYRSLIDHDPQVKPARDAFTAAEDRLKDARAKFHHESKNDAELHSAETLFRQSKAALDKAKSAFAVAEQKVVMLQSRLMADHQLIGR